MDKDLQGLGFRCHRYAAHPSARPSPCGRPSVRRSLSVEVCTPSTGKRIYHEYKKACCHRKGHGLWTSTITRGEILMSFVGVTATGAIESKVTHSTNKIHDLLGSPACPPTWARKRKNETFTDSQHRKRKPSTQRI